MAHHERINNWFLDHIENLHLEACTLKWVDNWLPGYTDFQVTISINDQPYVGRGTDHDEDLAFTKAAVEALERAACKTIEFREGGFAGHRNEQLAEESAKLELIERDAFLCHYLTMTPFIPVLNRKIKLPYINFQDIITKLSKDNIKISLFSMNSINDTNAYLCIADGVNFATPFGIIIGLGCAMEKKIAMEVAIIECLSNTVCCLDNKFAHPLSLKEFNSTPNPSPKHHAALGQNTDSSRHFLPLIGRTEISLKNNGLELSIESFISETHKPSFRGIGETPVYFSNVTSNCLQTQFTGAVTNHKVNLKRLSQFLGRDIIFEEINHYPHPIG